MCSLNPGRDLRLLAQEGHFDFLLAPRREPADPLPDAHVHLHLDKHPYHVGHAALSSNAPQLNILAVAQLDLQRWPQLRQ